VSAPAATGARIKAVVFDIGGILEPPFDDLLFAEMAETLGIPELRLRQHRAEDALALTDGRMTLRDFYARVGAGSGRAVDPAAAVARHIAVYRTATARLDARVGWLIQELRQGRVVACLTNTEVEIGQLNWERGLFTHFDRAFLSTELGLHKPDRQIFERVLADLGCTPPEAVFTDDKLENVAGARATGMPGIHYRDFEGFSRDLAELLEPGA
jgi:putative hydrolase of the HAD superfamily